MSTAEQHLQDEVDRLKEWRDGKHFRLESFVAERQECRRCLLTKPHVFVVSVNPSLSFSREFDLSAPVINHERVCRECLTDSEIAGLLLPAFHFVMTILLRDWQDPAVGDSDLVRSLHYVRAYLGTRSHIMMRPDKDQKELSLRALEGLKRIPAPEIDFSRLYSELEDALARNMFLAAHPDDVPESVEEARALQAKVGLFFRNGASIESYCLRDSVLKCVELFRRYFYRRVV